MVTSVLFTHFAYAKEKPHNITYYTEVFAPSSYYHNEQLIGLSVDLIKLIWRDLNIPEQPILVVPWARGYKEVSEKPITTVELKLREKYFPDLHPTLSELKRKI